VPKENLLHEIGRGNIVAFNILNAGASRWALPRRRFEARADDLRKVLQRTQSVWQTDWRVRLDEEKLAEMASRFSRWERCVPLLRETLRRPLWRRFRFGDKIQNTMKIWMALISAMLSFIQAELANLRALCSSFVSLDVIYSRSMRARALYS